MAQPTLSRTPSVLSTFATLAYNDTRLIGRDSFVLAVAGFSVIMSLILRFALPWAQDQVAATPGLDLDAASVFPAVIGYFVLFQAALIGGLMIGFVLLDERDDNTIQALMVTPMPMSVYLGYRVLVAGMIAWCLVMVEVLIINQVLVPLPQLALIAIVAAFTGAIAELILATLAGNKVEGFAQLKMLASSGLLLFGAWFLAEPAQFIVGLYTPYWGVKAYWLALEGNPNWVLAAVIGGVYSTAVVMFLVRRFNARVHSTT